MSSASISKAQCSVPLEYRTDRYRVSVEEYRLFRKNGFLIVPNLVTQHEIAELRQHTEDLMQGRLPEQQEELAGEVEDSTTGRNRIGAPPADLSPDEKAQYFLRVHMLHRHLALHERYMLHPRVLDVLEALIGPDILALQTMLFLKPPGKPGQGWHQDTFYIPTQPDSLCGAWIAIDDVDEVNGAMWFAQGSNSEPVYPPREGYGFGDVRLKEIAYISGVSDTDDSHNDLSQIADEYPQVLAPMRAGDVAFFGGHILHRSKSNFSTDRYRRSFVGHYCNARSFTRWGADAPSDMPGAALPVDPATGMANGSHILARGDTHLPFALPRFGTPCAAMLSQNDRRKQAEFAAAMMADMDSSMMEARPAAQDGELDHDDPD